ALLAILVKLSSAGPVFHRQERVGRDRRPFDMIKFRSMRADAEKDTGPIWAQSGDPRRTTLGVFLRKWSLDELPQLWNVVLGDMSLVGPRPEMVQIVEQYEPWQHQRHVVKPGITGLWQVSARGDLPMHEATDIDIDYVDSISFAKDLEILFKTIPAAMGDGKGH
ncbi:MAG: sugar transferase, partial [Acidimicrobiia bacterium]|nr:sugar transferase [Acidimicrobiia bacterium]